MLFLFRSAPEVEKRIHSKLFRKFWRSRGTKEPAYITVMICRCSDHWSMFFSIALNLLLESMTLIISRYTHKHTTNEGCTILVNKQEPITTLPFLLQSSYFGKKHPLRAKYWNEVVKVYIFFIRYSSSVYFRYFHFPQPIRFEWVGG